MIVEPELPYQDDRTLSANAQLVSAETTPLMPDGQTLMVSTVPGVATGGGGGGGGGATGAGVSSTAKMNAPGGASQRTLSPSAVMSIGTSRSTPLPACTVAMPLNSLSDLWTATTSTTLSPSSLRSSSSSNVSCIEVLTDAATSSVGGLVGIGEGGDATTLGTTAGALFWAVSVGLVTAKIVAAMAITAKPPAAPSHTGRNVRAFCGAGSGNSSGSGDMAPSHLKPSQ
ncbi:Uncharacterised protein [Mycolicibacterium tokaiense]|uniref:Uncharacterized protein n=1 Tax=Mycolicibacterium tokaiense TaxID=39695 RepID=A0A378TA21_9MYCO|nr:Uncharacterised protein [Mycolicibacterium tokaiense]